MKLTRLVLKEILHRKSAFALGVLCVTVASAVLVGALTLLRGHDIRTEQIVAAKEAEVKRRLAKLKDDYRKITKRMGFNVLILPKDQDLAALYAEGRSTKLMPQSYAKRLADSRVMTVRHLLPILRQRITWPEKRRTIILIGVLGEAPLLHRSIARKPIMHPVTPGTAVLGHELHESLNIGKGDKLRLMGRNFTVTKIHPERGNKDDITIWVDLNAAQEMLKQPRLISGILALECLCAWADVGKVRKEITSVLPDTKVVEFAGKALARAEARKTAARHAAESIDREKATRARLRAARESLAAVLAPIVIAACGVWVAYLAFSNVRERRAEIGILRALGVTSAAVLWIFLCRAIVMGLLGALLGEAIGVFAGAALAEKGTSAAHLASPLLLLLVALVTPALSAVAGFAPAVMASRQDPAEILREE